MLLGCTPGTTPVEKPRKAEPEPLAIEEGFVPAQDELRLFYRKVGSGPQTVVIPAGLFLEKDLETLAAPDRTLIFYDMRNRGRSDPVADVSQVGIQQDVMDLESVRVHFGVPRMHLVGWSYLGLASALYLFDHPDRVASMVLIGPIPPRSGTAYQREAFIEYQKAIGEEGTQRLIELTQSGKEAADPRAYYEEYWSLMKPTLFGDPARMDRYELPSSAYSNEHVGRLNIHFNKLFFSFGQYDWRETATGHDLPLLIVHGTLDRNAPIEGGREWAESFPGATLVTVEGAGHLPFVENPELVFPAIDRFLRGGQAAPVARQSRRRRRRPSTTKSPMIGSCTTQRPAPSCAGSRSRFLLTRLSEHRRNRCERSANPWV